MRVCVLLFSSVWDLLLWTANEKLLKEEDPPLFSEESIGYLSKRCAICNMRQIGSNAITGIKMDEIEQKDGKEARRQIEQSLIKPSEHLLMLNQADLSPRTVSALCFSCLFFLKSGEVPC